MNIWITYGIIAVLLLVAELIYFRIADKCNIIDKPNERSSHSTIVLRGGEIIICNFHPGVGHHDGSSRGSRGSSSSKLFAVYYGAGAYLCGELLG